MQANTEPWNKPYRKLSSAQVLQAMLRYNLILSRTWWPTGKTLENGQRFSDGLTRKTKPLRTQPKSNKKPLGKLMGATRIKKTVFYLGGVSPECSAEDIHSFCDSHCSLIDCRMLPSRRFGTQAARIVVQEDYATILEAMEWPQHLHLRKWNFHNSGTESGSGA